MSRINGNSVKFYCYKALPLRYKCNMMKSDVIGSTGKKKRVSQRFYEPEAMEK